MSRSLLHDWESSIEKNKNNTEELLKIAEDIYNTAYARGKASAERPQGEWIIAEKITCAKCPFCEHLTEQAINYCPWCGAKMT